MSVFLWQTNFVFHTMKERVMEVGKIVVKFGGSSLMNPFKIEQAVNKVLKFKEQGKQVIVVVSAMGKTTDNFLNLARSITNNNLDNALLDKLLNLGELKSAYLFCLSLISKGCKSISLNGDEAGIKTTGKHGNSFIKQIDISIINQHLQDGNVVVVAGFCGENEQHEISTLGRGGSDTTAVALASVLNCECHIFTDVSNVYTIDPRIYKKAKKIQQISFDDMLELSSFGAKVLETRCVEIAKKYNTAIHLAQSDSDEMGTIINDEHLESLCVTGVAVVNDNTLFKICITKENLENLLIDIDNFNFIIYSVSNNKNILEIIGSCKTENLQNLLNLTTKTTKKIEFCQNISQVSLIGVGFKSHKKDVTSILCDLLKLGIEIKYISLCECVISFWVNENKSRQIIDYLSSKYNLQDL